LIDGGKIRCLGHSLEFDLASGTCINARCDPLSTRLLPSHGLPETAAAPHLRVFD
jgi:UDP-MurNAc hydroxylase